MEKEPQQTELEKMAMVEAALYAAGKPLELDELAKTIDTRSNRTIYRIIKELADRYERCASALEIKELPGSRYVLQLRSSYSDGVRKLSNRPLLSKGPLKTLSYVAYYQPVEQTKVLDDRGRHCHSHIRVLEEMGLISRDRSVNKSYTIRTTPYFADYFGLSHNPGNLKVQLRKFFDQMRIQKIEDLNDNGLANGSEGSALGAPEPSLDPKDTWEKTEQRPLSLPQPADRSST